MAKRLYSNLNSAYFEAANKLKPKSSRRKIVAYVESYDDVFFWRQVLSRYEDATRYFEVMLPSRGKRLERGKKAAMMKLIGEGVGSSMIACVDADYDYLMQGATPTSKQLISNPYIFHTYAYSIENMQCYAPALHNVCVAVTLNDHAIFDFEEFFRQYSEAIFPLFVWSVWHYRTPHYNRFTITDFLRVIELGNFTFHAAEDLIKNVRRKAGKRSEQLRHDNPGAKESYQKVKDDLKRLGVTPETTYLYIQGHHLFNKVVVPMMGKVCDKLIRERENEIARGSVHGTQRRNELSCYTNSVADITSMLKKNFGYERSEEYARICADLQQFVDSLSTESAPENTVEGKEQ